MGVLPWVFALVMSAAPTSNSHWHTDSWPNWQAMYMGVEPSFSASHLGLAPSVYTLVMSAAAPFSCSHLHIPSSILARPCHRELPLYPSTVRTAQVASCGLPAPATSAPLPRRRPLSLFFRGCSQKAGRCTAGGDAHPSPPKFNCFAVSSE